ncbi:MAG: Flp pilus assembly protein CpaB [Anaerolineales bacterium]
MRNNRTVLIIVGVLILVCVVGGFFFWRNMQTGPTDPDPGEGDMTVEVPETQIVVAAQNVDPGKQLFAEDGAIRLQPWPEDSLPPEYFDSLDQVDGKFARMEIPRGMPILPRMLGEPGGSIAVYGSSASLFGDEGKRAYVIPMDTQGAVAWAIKPGDHVDVLAAIQLVPVDEEFQTPLPNLFLSLPTGGEDGQATVSGVYGRFETLPNGQPGLIFPSGDNPTHIVVQLTVQDAVVWHIGVWPEEEELARPTGVAREPEQGGGLIPEGGAAPQQQATPAPQPVRRVEIEPVTLLVTPQDALVLKYLQEMGADLDLALRAKGDTAPVITEPVWLSYILDRYQIPDAPPSLPVAPQSLDEQLQLTPLAPETPEE